MALGKLIIILAVASVALSDYYEVESENKTKKAVEEEKEQRLRSVNRGSFQRLSSLLNRTEDRKQKPRRNKNLSKILKMSRDRTIDNMMNDNEGAIAINQKTVPDNDTNITLTEKMKELRREGPMYEAVNKYNYLSQATGVYCNFENGANGSASDVCMWKWNDTLSSQGLGFKVVTAEDIMVMNETSRRYKFSGPTADAEGNPEGKECFVLS